MFYYKIFITIFYYDIILILGDVMNNINLNLLKYYFEVVNVGNITKASKNLLVSQPAITKAIKELENELNIILLERSKKGVIPTEDGIILYNHTKKLFQDFNSTLSILENNNKNDGHIYIGATTTNFLSYIMSSDYRIPILNPMGFPYLVVQAVFKLAPCYPSLELQVN